jgi:hypothetical protein
MQMSQVLEYDEGTIKEKQDFTYVEYKEASTAYFHGVEIGYTVVKHYITVNALLVALMGFLGTVEVKNPVLPSPVFLARLVPWVGVFFSVVLVSVMPRYWEHLKNVRNRCVEIEALYEGQLFTRLAKIESGRFGAGGALRIIVLLVAVLWLLFAIRHLLPPFIKRLAEFIP